MRICTFKLNDEPMSAFEIAGRSYPAFSGLDNHVNKRLSTCIPDFGPIPYGTYYIVDRESGGHLGPLRDAILSRQDWFALYANDGRIDDETFCNAVMRGKFRLHSGTRSKGCITIKHHADFNVIRGLLVEGRGYKIPGTNIKAYGKVIVS